VLTNSDYLSYESDDQDGYRNYSDIVGSPSCRYLKKRFRVRRLVCRVCKLKFSTRQETQAHIRREHRKIQAEK